jgi:hypothetical protein
MKPRSVIARCAAFFLLIVFLQKTGAGLLFHDLVHAKAANEAAAGSDNTADVSYTCSCIDDFLMPFTQADEPVGSIVTTEQVEFIAYHPVSVPFHSSVFSPLRGPPAGNL